MERKNLLKSIIVIGLSLILVVSFTNFVFADDDFDWDNATLVGGNETNNSVDNTLKNSTDNTLGNTAGNTTGNQLLNNVANNVANNTSKNTTNNVSSNSLAYTGSENGGIIAIIAVAGVVVTIYSYMKIKEYKNI